MQHLNSAFEKCDKLLIAHGKNKNNNLIALFYHHLNALLCSYYFCCFEIELINTNNIIYSDFEKEWSISYSQIFSKNFNYRFEKNKIPIKDKLRNIIKTFSIHDFGKEYQRIFIHPGASIDLKKIINLLKKEKINVCIDENKFSTKVKISLINRQIIILEDTINELSLNLPIKSILNGNELFTILKNRIDNHTSFKKCKKYNYDLVILGSLGKLNSRKIAMQSRLQNLPVIALAHGESMGHADEPLYGAVEQTFSDYYFSYGKKGSNDLQKGKFTKNLFSERSKIIPSNSNKVLKIYKTDEIIPIDNFDLKNIMYVPTCFNGCARYGPFRDIHDLAYLSWQYELIDSIKATIKPKKLYLKYHPKGKMQFFIDIQGLEIIKSGDLLNLFDKADIFIFDFPGSAFWVTLATNKPVIFFDLGLKNLTRNAIDLIKKRCIYIKSDPSNGLEACKKIKNEIKEIKRNHFTKEFCLGDADKTREESLLIAIQNIISTDSQPI